MHIPDGFVNAPVAISTTVLSLGGVAYALWQTGKSMPANRQALLGVSAAFIFAAQMVNFPVLNGTSGHLVGSALAAALLGIGPAIVVMTAVLIVQCFMFADGGLTALGANALNMAIINVVSAAGVYRLSTAIFGRGRFAAPVAAGLAGWVSTMVAAMACAGEVALSGKVQASLILPAMLITHAFIGIGEGLITALVLASVMRLRPGLLQQSPPPAWGGTLVYGTLAALAMGLFISPFACTWPDGLEKVAQRLGFASAEISPLMPGLLPDYSIPWLDGGPLSTSLAGGIGALIVLLLALLAARVVQRRKVALTETIPATDDRPIERHRHS